MTANETSAFIFDPKLIPTDPGCYLYYDKDDHLLYVGKAKNLRKRVSNYFQKNKKSIKTELMVSKIQRIETQIVNSEIEALILENNLVKEHKPKFNILLRDDKNFVYLRLTNEIEPKLEIVRRVQKDNATYFGPKTSAKDFRKTVQFCQKFFGAKMVKPNQDYYINQLLAKEVSLEEYQANIERMKRFLRGQTEEVLTELKAKMIDFAKNQNFEAAAKVRDTIESIQTSSAKQSVEFTDLIDRDFINFHREGSTVFLVRLAFRQGKLRDSNYLKLKAEINNEDAEIVTQFCLQFYPKVTDYPREIFVPELGEDHATLANFLSAQCFAGKTVNLIIPQKGDKKKILDLAAINARNQAEKAKLQLLSNAENFSKALPKLAEVLKLPKPPKRIECYDISHFSGSHTVASMVVFTDGQPQNSEYRRFKVKQLDPGKIDDFASMNEVLMRRFKRTRSDSPTGDQSKKGEPLTMKPVETEEEWENYHNIIETEIFHHYYGDRIEYNRNHPDLKKKSFKAYLFYKTGIVAGAMLYRDLTKTRGQIALIAVKKDMQKQGIGTEIVEQTEKIALEKGHKSLVLNANPAAVNFYVKNNFEKKFWKGNSYQPENIPLGKKLVVKKDKWQLPDLVVIDGGKGQLSSVMKIFETLNPPDKGDLGGFDPEMQVIALAKREELIYRPNQKDAIELPFESPALKLLQRIRDEAHRFAITFNRSLRKKSQTKSVLDEISGIGPSTKKKLLKQFESVGGVREASDEDLLKVVNQKQLESLRKQL